MVSILLGVSMVGEKLQPLIIGKSKNPRAFKELEIEKFDIKYEAIKTALELYDNLLPSIFKLNK